MYILRRQRLRAKNAFKACNKTSIKLGEDKKIHKISPSKIIFRINHSPYIFYGCFPSLLFFFYKSWNRIRDGAVSNHLNKQTKTQTILNFR